MTDSIHKTLSKIQQELKVPKDLTEQRGKYNYFTVDSILKQYKEIQSRYGENYITLTDRVLMIGDRFYVEATATFHLNVDKISCVGLAREEETVANKMAPSQITGASSTYARKRALSGLLALDGQSEDDPDATNTDNSNTIQKQVTVTSKQPVINVARLIEDLNARLDIAGSVESLRETYALIDKSPLPVQDKNPLLDRAKMLAQNFKRNATVKDIIDNPPT